MKQIVRIKHLRLLLSLLALACQATENGDTETGTETNWLKACQSDADCGELSCECGVCTRDCEADADCDALMGECATGQALAEQCGDTPRAAGLCLEANSNEADASGTGTDTTGNDTTTDETSDASDPDPTETEPDPTSSLDAATEPTSTTTDDSTSDPTTTDSDTGSEPSTDAAVDQTEQTDTDAGADGDPSDAGVGEVCESLVPELEGCCYQAADCGDGERCYDADCALPAAGRCALPPTGSCYANSDCAQGEHCENGALAPCGTLGPDALGTCVADCDEDSCHPERCDEAGEPCCDPFPGDGPNYCNATLACLGDVCATQETTTPEEQARQSCEQTGGTWDYEACGHYICGLPSDCTAIIPGCDCGPGRTFDTLGCAPESQCDEGAPTFECGDQSCGTITSQYCERFTGGLGDVFYTCRDVPEECSRVTCTCLVPDEGLPYTCGVGAGGELILQPPPAP
jgi:hypothetical protein